MVSFVLLALAAAHPIPADTQVDLGIALKLTHLEELNALKVAQQDPKSPEFRRWLSPQEFGARFGQGAATVQQLSGWLEAGGLEVSVMPSRAFLTAKGTAAQVSKLLAIKLLAVEGESDAVHTLSGRPRLPAALAGAVLNIAGLDTRVRYRHHLNIGTNQPTMGPQDVRRFYNLQPLLDQGWLGQGQTTVVLATATPVGSEPDPANINYYLQNIADVRTTFRKLKTNPGTMDLDRQAGAAGEFELDVQAQAIGNVAGTEIILVEAPASQVFQVGAAYIANNLAYATSVSISLGLCEKFEKQNDMNSGMDGIGAMRQTVVQGTMEGQTWSAASGDTGADDCRDRSGPATDFPSTIPEMIAAGGSMLAQPQWNANGALLTYQQETTWNAGNNGGAAGGGISSIFARPPYQAGLTLAGTNRLTPDIALMSGPPGVAIDSSVPGQLEPVQGTSVASPLSAGFFALVASRLGCRLGDLHPALYALGAAQADGGTAVFRDITTGNLTLNGITGPSAGPGYDSATGWGALDVAALAAALPGCTVSPDGGTYPNPTDAGEAYAQCPWLACDGGAICQTIPDGPSSCIRTCSTSMSPSGCTTGTVCSGDTLFSTGGQGVCVPGCLMDNDCTAMPGTVCSACIQSCIPAGAPTAHIGSGCTADPQCPNGALCSGSRSLTTNNGMTGYCTVPCVPNTSPTSTCACATGSSCKGIGRFVQNFCLQNCPEVGADCGRAGLLCQRQTAGSPVCLPRCTRRVSMTSGNVTDSCTTAGSGSLVCDVDSGYCGGPPPFDAGPIEPPDAGPMNPPDPVTLSSLDNTLGDVMSCSCSSGGAGAGMLLLLLGIRRRRP